MRDRDKARAQELERAGASCTRATCSKPRPCPAPSTGADVAYYLVHGMGRGSDGGFMERERKAARNFARAAKEAGVERVVYLGGLGENPGSEHLKSRHETGEILAEEGPPLTYFRAAMVVGGGSESYLTLRYLVHRLPLMIAPSWLSTPTQPIGIDDVVAYLRGSARAMTPGEVQIGGPDVLSYSRHARPHGQGDGQARRARRSPCRS